MISGVKKICCHLLKEEFFMLNDTVKTLLKSTLWDLATVSPEGEPNVVPVAFKDITDEGHLLVGDVFLETTLKNIKANGRIAVSAFDGPHLTGYQIKGHAKYIESGAVVDNFKKVVEEMFKGAVTAKGALEIIPEKVIVTTPGPDNKKEL